MYLYLFNFLLYILFLNNRVFSIEDFYFVIRSRRAFILNPAARASATCTSAFAHVCAVRALPVVTICSICAYPCRLK